MIAFAADPDRRLDRDGVEWRARRGAAALAGLGVKPGDCVAVLMRNNLAQIEVMRAVARTEAVLLALNWHGAAEEVADILADSNAQLVIAHRDLIPGVGAALDGRQVIAVTPGPAIEAAYGVAGGAGTELPDWADLLSAAAPGPAKAPPMRPMLRYTSGSTGKPKGIRRIPKPGASGSDFAKVLAHIGAEMMHCRPGMRFYTAAPLYHSAPSTLLAMALATEDASVYVSPRFEPEAMLADIARERITHVYLVPTMMSRMLKLPDAVKARYDLSSVEFCVSTGSPWPHDLKSAMIGWWGPVFWESYGASEIGFMTMVSSEEALARPGTAGRIQLGGSILICDEAGRVLPQGEIGIIHVRMDAFGGFDYAGDPDARRRAEVEGHVSVGDMGWLDEDGYLFITDRKKDMIISGGANIFPAEIEAVLMRAPFIRDCAVFGAPDPEFGERIVAAIEPAPGWAVNEAEVRGFLDGRLARMKHPRILAFHDRLPREDSGKIFKQRLRAPYWEGTGRLI